MLKARLHHSAPRVQPLEWVKLRGAPSGRGRGAEDRPLAAVFEAPVEMVEAVAALRLPPRADRHLQALMDRNTNGVLTPAEREELDALVELSETIALLR